MDSCAEAFVSALVGHFCICTKWKSMTLASRWLPNKPVVTSECFRLLFGWWHWLVSVQWVCHTGSQHGNFETEVFQQILQLSQCAVIQEFAVKCFNGLEVALKWQDVRLLWNLRFLVLSSYVICFKRLFLWKIKLHEYSMTLLGYMWMFVFLLIRSHCCYFHKNILNLDFFKCYFIFIFTCLFSHAQCNFVCKVSFNLPNRTKYVKTHNNVIIPTKHI